ncbi:MAG: T9SS type A sorting domain-containing protein [Cytophagales bacterium]|nr:T9SS type A sorting domain-containing protein [Cytophagales bacterium]
MKKVLYTAFLLVTMMVSYAQLPTIGTLYNNKLNLGVTSNYLLLGGITDGSGNTQTITGVTAESSNPALLSVVGVTYTSPDQHAILWVHVPASNAGSVVLTVTATDVDGTFSKTLNVILGDFYKKGVILSVYDLVFWSKTFPTTEKSVKDTLVYNVDLNFPPSFYCPLGLTVGPSGLSGGNANCDPNAPCDDNNAGINGAAYSCFQRDDGMTTQYKGFIFPTVTGVYTFTINSQDAGDFRINDHVTANSQTSNPDLLTVSNVQYKYAASSVSGILTNRSPVTYTQVPLAGGNTNYTTTLIGGNAYAFKTASYHVFSKNFTLRWSGPGFGTRAIDTAYLKPYYDVIKPTIGGVALPFVGTNSARLIWNKATQSDVEGYYVYMNGTRIATTKNLTYSITGLNPTTHYSVFVVSYDRTGNESQPSTVFSFSTFGNNTTPPTAPTAAGVSIPGDLSVVLTWTGAAAFGNQIMGYNLSINGVKYNTALINDPTINVVTGLLPKTNFTFRLQAVDGNGNVSTLSSAFNFTTTSFNPLTTAPGIKKARLSYDTKAIARNAGIGINGDYLEGNYYNGNQKMLLEDLRPTMQRWGALTSNPLNFSAHSGPSAAVTFADFVKQCNDLGSMAALSVGTKDGTDWRTNPVTFRTFAEYLWSPVTTSGGGQIRANEGYPEPLINKSPGIFIEYGNEVWGAAAHNAEIGANYVTYGQWCRDMTAMMRTVTGFDSTKVQFIYCGRYPSNDYIGLHSQLRNTTVGNKLVDVMAISGYMGGNLNYDPNVPTGVTELAYYKSGMRFMANALEWYKSDYSSFSTIAKGNVKFFMYESNMTTGSYNGRQGQGLLMSDYYMSAQKIAHLPPGVFHLIGGEWRITEAVESFRRLPFFYMIKLINAKSLGNMLNTTLTTVEKARDDNNNILVNYDPVGNYITHNNGKYAVLFFSRDFENDYQVQLNLLDGVSYSSSGKMYTIKGVDYNDKYSTIDSSTVTISDSMYITVPKHSLVIYTFNGPTLPTPLLPLGYTSFRKSTSLAVTSVNGATFSGFNNLNLESNVFDNTIELMATGFPTSSTDTKDIKWTVTKTSDFLLDYTVTGNNIVFKGNNTCRGAGVAYLKAELANDPSVFHVITINSNQQDEAIAAEGLSCADTATVYAPKLTLVAQNDITSLNITSSTPPVITITAIGTPAFKFTNKRVTWGNTPEVSKAAKLVENTVTGNELYVSSNDCFGTGIYQIQAVSQQYPEANAMITVTVVNSFVNPSTTCESVTALDKYTGEITIYPNPATGTVNVQCSKADLVGYTLTNTLGNPVKSGSLTGGFSSFDVSDVAQGIYYLQINAGGYIIRKKLIKN